MTATYEKNNCLGDCMPGIKCDYCGSHSPRKISIQFLHLSEDEKRLLGTDRENLASGAPAAPDPSSLQNLATGKRFFTMPAAAEAFEPQFMNEDGCRQWIIARLHPSGAHCPECGLKAPGGDRHGFWAGKRVHCGRCGLWFTARTGTFLQGAQFSYSEVFLLAALVEYGVHIYTIARILGVSADTVRLWIKKFGALEAHG